MDLNRYTEPRILERYSFLWSEARLIIAAIALFMGGVPPLMALNPVSALYGFFSTLLKLSWLISGAASIYLIYRWNSEQKLLFGGKDQKDTVAFFVSIISGVNLGLTGLLGSNIGMSISSSYILFIVVGLCYLASAGYLYMRWNKSGQKIF